MKQFVFFIILLLTYTNAYSWRISENGSYLTIEDGDTLWEIAHSLYSKGYDYKRLWNAFVDKGLTDDPSLIYDGMRIELTNIPKLKPDETTGSNVVIVQDTCCISSQDTLNFKLTNIDAIKIPEPQDEFQANFWKFLFEFLKVVFLPVLGYIFLRWIKKKYPQDKRLLERILMLLIIGFTVVILVSNFNLDIAINNESSLNWTIIFVVTGCCFSICGSNCHSIRLINLQKE